MCVSVVSEKGVMCVSVVSERGVMCVSVASDKCVMCVCVVSGRSVMHVCVCDLCAFVCASVGGGYEHPKSSFKGTEFLR